MTYNLRLIWAAVGKEEERMLFLMAVVLFLFNLTQRSEETNEAWLN